ncbi:MAG: tRNA (adenosine(37)-N6)-threonylcarbamoyltransferase complex dimerization subunit type 1 TsaB [Clostridia bacterium]|nr:tRNA (adenosine(37)-N6)-threonylcarbamoyltransferase complex dimerization subunit type 1 TsaB [Clostridia bacterium]
MSRYLAIDASSKTLRVLAVNGDKKAERTVSDAATKHSVMLMDEADAAFKEAELTPSECDFFCAVTGPGSFTGIRIGISAAKGFALAAGKKLLAVTAFEPVAEGLGLPDFAVVIDAGRDTYYVCRYKGGEAGEPAYMTREETESLRVPLFGEEDLSLSGYTKKDGDLYGAVEKHKEELTGNIGALYIRKSQAEEGRK